MQRGGRKRESTGDLYRLARFNVDNKLGAAGPGTKLGRGVALSECFHSFVGQLADVPKSSATGIRVRRVFAVVDCGFAIDPPNVIAQIRSAIEFRALRGAVWQGRNRGRQDPAGGILDSYPKC